MWVRYMVRSRELPTAGIGGSRVMVVTTVVR